MTNSNGVGAAIKQPLSINSLFSRCEKAFGYDEAKVRAILKESGYAKYDPAWFWNYFQVVAISYRSSKELLQTLQFCPICKGEIEADHSRDHKFGCLYGWKCKANRFHFIEYQLAHLSSYMQRNYVIGDESTNPNLEGIWITI